MKHIGIELEKIIYEKRFVKSDVAKKIGLSAVYFYKVLTKATIDASLLERISTALNISPAYFFDDYQERKGMNSNKDITASDRGQVHIHQTVTTTPEDEVKLLRQLLEEKERTIQILMKDACNGTISGQTKK